MADPNLIVELNGIKAEMSVIATSLMICLPLIIICLLGLVWALDDVKKGDRK